MNQNKEYVRYEWARDARRGQRNTLACYLVRRALRDRRHQLIISVTHNSYVCDGERKSSQHRIAPSATIVLQAEVVAIMFGQDCCSHGVLRRGA